MQFFHAPRSCMQTTHSVLLSVASWEWFKFLVDIGTSRQPGRKRISGRENRQHKNLSVLGHWPCQNPNTDTFMQNSLRLSHSLFCRLLLWVCHIWGLCMAQKQMQSHPRSELPSRKVTISGQRLRTWSTSEHLWRCPEGHYTTAACRALVWLIRQSSYTLHHCQCHHCHHPWVRVIISPVNPGAIRRTRHAKYQMSVIGRTW